VVYSPLTTSQWRKVASVEQLDSITDSTASKMCVHCLQLWNYFGIWPSNVSFDEVLPVLANDTSLIQVISTVLEQFIVDGETCLLQWIYLFAACDK
jgi:hypothetical protein